MTTVQLDETLIRPSARRGVNHLTVADRVAANLFWRCEVSVPILAKVFKTSKNTLYYTALSGQAPSYPKGKANKARETNEIIERMGPEAAWDKYVTDEMVKAVNVAMRRAKAQKTAA